METIEEKRKCTICTHPLDDAGHCPNCDEVGRVWTIRDWRPLLSLSLIIILGFSFTRLMVNLFDQRQATLAAEYYSSGVRAMEANRPAEAVDAFESALVYSRDNFQYRLKLTDALLATGASKEAMAQLRAFHEQNPSDAMVNLKLARLEAGRQRPDDAIRYYENAIDGVWPEHTDPLPQRIAARIELANYLIAQGKAKDAQSALLALAAVLPADSAEQQTLGDLFLSNGDATDALRIFEAIIQLEKSRAKQRLTADDAADERYSAALLAAAKADFALGDFGAARRYLEQLQPDTASRQMLAQLDRVATLDPFSPEITLRQRRERIVTDYQIALRRLAACGFSSATSAPPPLAQFAAWSQQLAPMMDERKLRGKDEVVESTMRFAFQSELAAKPFCGQPTPDDEALLLLARNRLGAAQ